MPKIVEIQDFETIYNETVKGYLQTNDSLTADRLIDISLLLYNDFKVKNVSEDPKEEGDMLLFQYGVYNWGDDTGEHFSFDITRQFITMDTEEMYQISFSLIFDPNHFKDCEDYNSWSSSFTTIKDWYNAIKQTTGYRLAKEHMQRRYKIQFFTV